jgi:hypothetical protein
MTNPNITYWQAAAPFPARDAQGGIDSSTVDRFPTNLQTLTPGRIVQFGAHTTSTDQMVKTLMPNQFDTKGTRLTQQAEKNGGKFFNWSLFPVVFTSQIQGIPSVQVAPYMCLVTSEEVPNANFIPSSRNFARQPDSYKVLTIPRQGKRPARVHVDTTFIRASLTKATIANETDRTGRDTVLALAAAIKDVDAPDEMYITMFPFVLDVLFEQRIEMFRSYDVSPQEVWGFSGPSFGLALAAAIHGMPPMMYTGFLSQIGERQTLSNASSTGLAETLIGANVIENIDLVEYKVAWAVKAKYPIIIPTTTSQLQPLTEVLERIGRQMLIIQRSTGTFLTQGAITGAYGPNPTDKSTGENFSGLSYFVEMKEAIFTTQDINLGKDFSRFGSYILPAATLTDCNVLSAVASMTIVGNDPTGNFVIRGNVVKSLSDTKGEPRIEQIAIARKAAKKPTAARKAKKALAPTKAQLKQDASKALAQQAIASLLGSSINLRTSALAGGRGGGGGGGPPPPPPPPPGGPRGPPRGPPSPPRGPPGGPPPRFGAGSGGPSFNNDDAAPPARGGTPRRVPPRRPSPLITNADAAAAAASTARRASAARQQAGTMTQSGVRAAEQAVQRELVSQGVKRQQAAAAAQQVVAETLAQQQEEQRRREFDEEARMAAAIQARREAEAQDLAARQFTEQERERAALQQLADDEALQANEELEQRGLELEDIATNLVARAQAFIQRTQGTEASAAAADVLESASRSAEDIRKNNLLTQAQRLQRTEQVLQDFRTQLDAIIDEVTQQPRGRVTLRRLPESVDPTVMRRVQPELTPDAPLASDLEPLEVPAVRRGAPPAGDFDVPTAAGIMRASAIAKQRAINTLLADSGYDLSALAPRGAGGPRTISRAIFQSGQDRLKAARAAPRSSGPAGTTASAAGKFRTNGKAAGGFFGGLGSVLDTIF